MKLKKLLLLTSVMSTFAVIADEEISYNWLEIDAGFNEDIKVLKLEGSKKISNNFYITANASKGYKDHDYLGISNDRFDRTILSGSLGFKTNISKRTDFYAEFGVEYSKEKYPINRYNTNQYFDYEQSDFNPISKLGTRTKFNEKFELTTSIFFANNDYPYMFLTEVDSDGDLLIRSASRFDSHDLDFSLKGLYNLTEKSSLTLGLSSSDKDGFASIGWRRSW